MAKSQKWQHKITQSEYMGSIKRNCTRIFLVGNASRDVFNILKEQSLNTNIHSIEKQDTKEPVMIADVNSNWRINLSVVNHPNDKEAEAGLIFYCVYLHEKDSLEQLKGKIINDTPATLIGLHLKGAELKLTKSMIKNYKEKYSMNSITIDHNKKSVNQETTMKTLLSDLLPGPSKSTGLLSPRSSRGGSLYK